MDSDGLGLFISGDLEQVIQLGYFLALAGENIECYKIRQKVCDMPITMPAI